MSELMKMVTFTLNGSRSLAVLAGVLAADKGDVICSWRRKVANGVHRIHLVVDDREREIGPLLDFLRTQPVTVGQAVVIRSFGRLVVAECVNRLTRTNGIKIVSRRGFRGVTPLDRITVLETNDNEHMSSLLGAEFGSERERSLPKEQTGPWAA